MSKVQTVEWNLVTLLNVTISLDNRGYATNPDGTWTSVFSTLAGTVKDITESPYFPKMAFKKVPASNIASFSLLLRTSQASFS